MWEGACPRLRWASQPLYRLTHRYRGQAPSHIGYSVISAAFFHPEQAVTVPIIKPKPPGSDL
ncbi:hypothetical protein FHP26_18890 [Pseudomonas orientalis]|nr:hypothetical protein [Pseudomonas orientalis]